MKKTVTVNISGIFFHINEDAYEKLSNYLKTISSYFKNSEGNAEIMADIEARIAEMFKEKLSPSKQVISMEDVDEVIAIMGQPEAFMDEASGQKEFSDTAIKTERRNKRLFRDPDDHVIGGVCSGIAAYFGFDPFWLRIVFVLMFFAFGTGPLLYIILWIIIPKAKTASEKLEMRGETINVNNISRTINEEFDTLKQKLDDIKNDAKNINKGPFNKAKSVIEDIVELLLNIIKLFLKAIVKLAGVILIAIGLALSIFFVGSLIGSNAIISITTEGISSFSPSELVTIFFDKKNQYLVTLFGLILLIGIPILSLLFAGFKLLLGIKTKIKGIGMVFGALWTAGVIICAIIAFQMINEFSKKGIDKSTVTVSPTFGSTLYLDINDDKFYGEKFISYHSRSFHLIQLEEDKIYFGFPEMDIIKSETDSFEIEIIRSSRSKTHKEAVDRAKRINYRFNEMDSILKFDPFYSVSAEDKFRMQKVRILVKVPEGKSVELSKKMDRIIYDVDNFSNTLDSDMAGKKWAMTEKGLTCMNCEE